MSRMAIMLLCWGPIQFHIIKSFFPQDPLSLNASPFHITYLDHARSFPISLLRTMSTLGHIAGVLMMDSGQEF